MGSLLGDMLEVPFSSNALKSKVVRSTLLSRDLPADFSEKDFRRVLYRIRNRLDAEGLLEYRVVFPIWNRPAFLCDSYEVNGIWLDFTPSMETDFFRAATLARSGQHSDANLSFIFTDDRLADLKQCTLCAARVRASSPSDAHERAADSLYEILALVNIAKDRSKVWRNSHRIQGKLPVSEVLIGPHTTAHFENGNLAYDGLWHEKWAGGPRQPQLTEEKANAWERRWRQLFQAVQTSRWSRSCKSAARRYFAAFSNPNLEECFLDGWRLFENITGGRYDDASKKLARVASVFEDHQEYSIIGKHLATRRNLLSHGHAIQVDDSETLAFQMLRLIIPYLELYIINGFSFERERDFLEFLDLPISREERDRQGSALRKGLSLLEKAAIFRREGN